MLGFTSCPAGLSSLPVRHGFGDWDQMMECKDSRSRLGGGKGGPGPRSTTLFQLRYQLLHHKVTTCFDHGQDTEPVLFSTWRQSWVANLAVKLHLMREIHGTQSLKNNDVYLETFEAQLAELGRERAAVDVDVDPERRSPRYHETCLAL